MKNHGKLFKHYDNENGPILKATKHKNFKNAQNFVMSKIRE